MEFCDTSLLKKEIVELIKTEPQKEDEFVMFGQSGIKTEDESDTSNSFEEIVKDEGMLYDSSFGIMDSKLDHFTPVDKSEVFSNRDESDTSHSFDEIVKDEIMLYDSSFGIMDSNIDHFTPVDKSEEEIVSYMEEPEGNVKLRIVLRMLRQVDIV
uniref:(California timema) hypothetical protein n=1 Tax=Timema californicum TaxID=61474 RepID=A0A7R9JFF1_TIMCA|nr:unnamed protein product [Timema californicum]